MGVIMENFGLPSRDDGLISIEIDIVPGATGIMYETERGYQHLSEAEQEIFNLDISSLRLAKDRGSVAVVTRILRDDPYFMSKARALGPDVENEILDAISWLSNAEAFEDAKGRGSMLKSDHPFNVQMAASLKKHAERAAAFKAFWSACSHQ